MLDNKILTDMGFESEAIEGFNFMKLYLRNVGMFRVDNKGNNICYFQEDNDEQMNVCGNCTNLLELVKLMVKITNFKAMDMGKEFMRQEMRNLLGIRK